MKVKLILPLPIIVGLIVALVISVFYFKLNAESADEPIPAIGKLRMIKHDNALLNEALFEIDSGHSDNYDAVNSKFKVLSDRFKELKLSEVGLDHINDAEFNQKILDLEIALTNKVHLIERIKTNHALLRNSLDYYPTIAKEVKYISDNNRLHADFVNMMEAVVYYVMSGDDVWFLEGIGLIDKLKSEMRNNSRPDKKNSSYLINFLAHSEIILNRKHGQVGALSIEDEVPLNERIDVLHNAYMKHHSENLKSAEVYRDVMLAASILLVIIAIYMLVIIFNYSKELAASRAKSIFLANMSHEIRTPLTAIIGFGEATLENHQTHDERLSAIRAIVRNGKHLLSIINGMLDASKIESGKLETEVISVDLTELLGDVDSVVGMLVAEKGLLFKLKYLTPIPNKIFTDPVRLKQILLNICSNAVKFTKQGQVELAVSCQPDQHKIRFSVIDSGVGISKAEIGKLFKPFSQADASTTRKYGGTGLGLHISRELAKRLGGDINLASSTGQGTQFDVVIDTGSLDEVVFSDEAAKSSNLNRTDLKSAVIPQLKGAVLIADDSSDNQKLIAYHIHKAGVSTVIAENGKLALDMASGNDFDLILMDMQMPVMGGIEATKKLRQSGYTKPIVALTANAFDDDVAMCREAGCDEFLSKPIDWKQFFWVLSAYLESNDVGSDGESPLVSEMLDDDPEIEEFIKGLVDDLPGRMEQIDQSYKDKDWDNLKQYLHKIKGTLGSFGYPQVSELAARMEIELKDQNTDQFDLSMAELLNLIERIIKGRPK